jgi:hypothetical protein
LLNALLDIITIKLLTDVSDVLKTVLNVPKIAKPALNVPLLIFYSVMLVTRTAQKELIFLTENVYHAKLDVFHALLTAV